MTIALCCVPGDMKDGKRKNKKGGNGWWEGRMKRGQYAKMYRLVKEQPNSTRWLVERTERK